MKGKSESNHGGPFTLPFFVLFMAFPFLAGVYLSNANLDWINTILSPLLVSKEPERVLSVPLDDNLHECYNRLRIAMFNGLNPKRHDNPFHNLSIVVHRNGETEPCGETRELDVMEQLKKTIEVMNECPTQFYDKYQIEALLTRTFHLMVSSSCTSLETTRDTSEGFFGYCDMGEAKTPILLDHDRLVPIPTHGANNKYLPCHFHDKHGVRITTLSRLANIARYTMNSANGGRRELHIYAVPAGRVFMFAPKYVDEIIPLPHVRGSDPSLPVYLKVLSISPRVFDLINFFSIEESRDLIARAMKEKSESHRLKRSSTGPSGYNVDDHRTSESGFDTNGKTTMDLKRRGFDVLGFDEFIPSHADGLQILRYNQSTAYNSHLDWIQGNKHLKHDYNSAGKGGNRFATILLYMSDLSAENGGETVFLNAHQDSSSSENHDEAIRLLVKGSWEEQLSMRCKMSLALRPKAGRAILFYSQLPNGEKDTSSLHAACPVLSGQKWAANLWVWNTPREGYRGHPINPHVLLPE